MRSLVLATVGMLVWQSAGHAQTWALAEGPGSTLFASGRSANGAVVTGLACEEPDLSSRVEPTSPVGIEPIEGLRLFVATASFPALGTPLEGVEAAFLVDGRLALTSALQYDATRNELFGTLEPRHPFVDALRRGNRVTIRLASGQETTVGLQGSARSIDAQRKRCRFGQETHEAAADVITPVALEPLPPEIEANVADFYMMTGPAPYFVLALGRHDGPLWTGAFSAGLTAEIFDMSGWHADVEAPATSVRLFSRYVVLAQRSILFTAEDFTVQPERAALCIVHATPLRPERRALRLYFLAQDERPPGTYLQMQPALSVWEPADDPCRSALLSLSDQQRRLLAAR